MAIFGRNGAVKARSDAASLVGISTPSVFRLQGVEVDGTADRPCPLRAVWAEGQSLNVNHDTLVRADGRSTPVAYSATPLVTDGHKGAVIVFEDITQRAAEQLRIERELKKLEWVGRIRDALDSERFVLYAQPIIDLTNGHLFKHELLIRMIGVNGEIIPPDQFLPTAEEFGLITEIDRWVVLQTARLAALGHSVEFNLSAKSVVDPHMLATIESAIEETGARPENIVCEITETALVRDIEAADTFVRGLNRIGCRVAFDDFGAGYGGFAYLKRLPVSFLKIDREFVTDICEESSSQHVVAAVVSLARAFGMKVIAEGVEYDSTLELLTEMGVDHAQGFGIGRPIPIAEALGEQQLALPFRASDK